MKYTYLIYKDNDASKKELVVATQQEWDAIMKQNKILPKEKRRYFTKDCIDDDCMFIETSKEEYDNWHSAHEVANQKRAYKQKYSLITTSEQVSEEGEMMGGDVLPSDYNLEQEVVSSKHGNESWRDYRASVARCRF